MSILQDIKGGLVVSCQALENEPLHGSHIMARMALAAKMGGASGIRANSPEDIQAIKDTVNLPLIGIYKRTDYASDVYITPTFNEARLVADAGADMIAIDATCRQRPDKIALEDLVRRIQDELKLPVMGDVSTLSEGIKAEEAGIDVVGTTLAGYTEYSPQLNGPDFGLLESLLAELSIPVILEGRVTRPEQIQKALEMGAHAVVVGGAITRPDQITARFAAGIERAQINRRSRSQ